MNSVVAAAYFSWSSSKEQAEKNEKLRLQAVSNMAQFCDTYVERVDGKVHGEMRMCRPWQPGERERVCLALDADRVRLLDLIEVGSGVENLRRDVEFNRIEMGALECKDKATGATKERPRVRMAGSRRFILKDDGLYYEEP